MERNTGKPSQDHKGTDLRLRTRSPKIRLQTMIPEELLEKIQATAAEYDTSVSEVACKILSKYYEE